MHTHRIKASYMAIVSIQKLGSGRDLLDHWLQLSATAADHAMCFQPLPSFIFITRLFASKTEMFLNFCFLTVRNLLLIFRLKLFTASAHHCCSSHHCHCWNLSAPPLLFTEKRPVRVSASGQTKSLYNMLMLLMIKLFALLIANLQ